MSDLKRFPFLRDGFSPLPPPGGRRATAAAGGSANALQQAHCSKRDESCQYSAAILSTAGGECLTLFVKFQRFLNLRECVKKQL